MLIYFLERVVAWPTLGDDKNVLLIRSAELSGILTSYDWAPYLSGKEFYDRVLLNGLSSGLIFFGAGRYLFDVRFYSIILSSEIRYLTLTKKILLAALRWNSPQ